MGLLQNIKNLFGIKDDDRQTIQNQQAKGAYFLDADAAKTFGNIDYMRQPKVIERTFPKVEGMNKGGLRKVAQFSATDATVVFDGNDEETSTASESSSAASTSAATPASPAPTPIRKPSTSTDSALDFRSMARDIKR